MEAMNILKRFAVKLKVSSGMFESKITFIFLKKTIHIAQNNFKRMKPIVNLD